MAKPASKHFMYGLTAVSILVAGASLYAAWRDHALANPTHSSQCVVIGGRITSGDDSSRSCVEVTIEHEVNGKVYRRDDTGRCESTSAGLASDIPRVGTTMPCFYVDRRPDLVTIFPGKPSQEHFFIGFAVFALLLPVVMNAIERRKRKRRG